MLLLSNQQPVIEHSATLGRYIQIRLLGSSIAPMPTDEVSRASGELS